MDNYIKELFYDEPIEYNGLSIYPVTMKEYIEFHLYVNCLLLDKNSIPDVSIISMSYLHFLYYISETQKLPYVYMLKLLLFLVLHLTEEEAEKMMFYVRDNKAYFSVKGKEYDSNDFDKISSIIMEQNGIRPIDNTIQKELRDALEEAENYKMRQNGYKICSLEEQMICVMISTPLKLEDIYNLTIRKFEKVLARVDAKLHYQIYLSASLSGFVKIDNSSIKHWLSDLSNPDRYAGVKVDEEEFRNKIDGINGVG